jgi:hypothetical protein
VTAWRRRLALHGLIPVMQILEGPVSYAQAAIREEAWRRAHVAAGSELLNAVPCVDGRHEGNTIWTAETAREEVRALASRLQLGGAYPTRRQFADSGVSGLDTAIERRLGGHRAIAAAIGLVMPTPEWTLAAAEHTVCNLVATHGLERYPTPKEFADADQSGCFTRSPLTSEDARRSRGDSASPARETNGRARRPMPVVSLVARLGGTRRYPSDREMRRYGPPGLESAARRFGGNRTRAERLGLFLRPRWELDTAAAAVCELVERLSLGGYPTQRHFTDARKSGLYRAIAKRLGGHQAMAARLDLQPPHPRRR